MLTDDLASFPLDALLAELERRDEKPSCGTRSKQGSYNTGIHVFALFLILALSTLGRESPLILNSSLTSPACSFPVIARRFPKLPIPHRFLFLSRHFGTGVLIATAFIHLLPTAFISMTDPCLPNFWNKDYPPMAGFIAMMAVFVVVSIEMFFASRGAGHTHGSDWDRPEQGLALHHLNTPVTPYMDNSPRPPLPNDDDDDDDDLEALDAIVDESATLNHPHQRKISEHENEFDPHKSPDGQDPKKLFLQCLLLEAGILFHSVFIGMAVSVATGTQFVVLLVAICFHQTFEGFALGSRIAALIPALFDASSPKPWLMALAYGATTPIGQAIGIWMHGLYDPASKVGLLMVGITNAVSSGLLLFAGLVQLIAEDFLSDGSYKTLTGRRRIEACLAVALGGLLMAVVGAFA